ncbi:MAG TPA: hypothetical protein VMP01_07600 [Pirellulaceae bacterium]|nr:hypothetical protein [Pirellulaceae bacterium]
MGKTVQLHLQPVRVRQRLQRALAIGGWGLLTGSMIGLIAAAVNFWFGLLMASWIPLAIAFVGVAAGMLAGWLWQHELREAAFAVDQHYRLKDRATTALEFAGRQQASVACQLALDDALTHLKGVNPREVVPLRVPRVVPYAVAALLATGILVGISVWNKPAIAEPPTALDVVVAQADRITDELKELEEFAKEEKNTEIEKLVEEIKAAAEELRKPGVDTREALAKLSEMQAALQQEQAKYNVAAMDAQLKAVGEALALAEPLAEAGQALSSGQYEKAAELLEQLEQPQLDRQTEKAVKEKLDAAAKQMSDHEQSSLSKAAGEMSQGLGGDGKKFSEGSKKLAGESRKQGKRKKLSDLLQKQCNCLSECKGECECEGNNKSLGKSKGKGGKNWGLGASGGELGERTPQLGGKKMEKITGKQSDEGDIEVETTHSPEGTQDAQRGYRENYAKYKKISESVLESEPIPLGHRQTIRRYFESIRPNEAETDEVNRRTSQ